MSDISGIHLENEITHDGALISPPPVKRRTSRSTSKKKPAPFVDSDVAATSSRYEITEQLLDTEQSSKTATPSISSTEERILSVIFYQSYLGAAYYDTENCVLNVFQDLSETTQFHYLMRVFNQTDPTTVLVSSKEGSPTVRFLQDVCFDEENSDKVKVLSPSFFTYESAKRRILNTNSVRLPKKPNEEHKILHYNSTLNFDDKNSVRAAGALLRYIDSNRVGMELEDSVIDAPVIAVTPCTLRSSLYLDKNSLFSLQIFADENHPASAKRGIYRSGKEGLSLFGQMNRTKSRLGYAKLRHWFKTPSRDSQIILRRQNAIRYFSRDENCDKCIAIYECLKKVKSLSKIVAKMMSSHISVHDWNTLYNTVYNLTCLLDICRSIDNSIEMIDNVLTSDFSGLREISAVISKVMDLEESKIKNKFVVKYGIDEELDEKKKIFHGLPHLMTKVAEEELASLDSRVEECNVIYLPQLGYMVTIEEQPFLKEEENYRIGDLEFVFINKGIIHYKSQQTRNLDHLLGDTQNEICDHESGIMHRLQNMVIQNSQVLLEALDIAAEFDCILSIASFSKDYDLCYPEVVSDKTIRVYGGRHILYETCAGQFVPNDAIFDVVNGLVKVVSGPNACGKSVYLKQVALIVFMMHIGSPVPAASAQICICDSIFTRVRCIESVSINLSTFILDINQISKAVNGAQSRSLVVIDEFGKGTNQNDGIGLFTATLAHWINQAHECPFVLAATHYHGIFKKNLLPRSPFVRYQTFSVMLDKNRNIVYLYELSNGICAHSQANFVAKSAGIDDSILRRADELLVAGSKRAEVGVSKTQRINMAIVREFLDLDTDSVESFHSFLSFIGNRTI